MGRPVDYFLKPLFMFLVFAFFFIIFWYADCRFTPGSMSLLKILVLISAWTMSFAGMAFINTFLKFRPGVYILLFLLVIGITGDVVMNRAFLKPMVDKQNKLLSEQEPRLLSGQEPQKVSEQLNTDASGSSGLIKEKPQKSPGQKIQSPPFKKVLVFLAINLSLLLLAVSGGMLLSFIVDRATYIIPLSMIAGLADIWSVFAPGGVTKSAVSKPEILNYALLTFPVPGRGVMSLIGVTDFIFAALYLALSDKFRLNRKKSLVLIGLSFVLSTILAVFAGLGIPVLPIMGALFIIFHYNDIKITDKKELKEAVTGILIVILMLGIISVLRTSGI